MSPPKFATVFVIPASKSQLALRIALLCLCVLLSCKSFAQCSGCCDTGCPDPTHFACLDDCNCYLISPIIVDTTGKGFHLTSADAGVLFDMAGDGHPLQIAWTATGSGNAFLALDRNHNGKIDRCTELFGNFTAQPQSHNPNGFLALSDFDKPENGGNNDGIIDDRDDVFLTCSYGLTRTTTASPSRMNCIAFPRWGCTPLACTIAMIGIYSTSMATGFIIRRP